ncbi:hypothetical protein B7P43_G00344 [Cryptotermes secundus]|uniref:Uncharacterized protein n=2 Tax=Cryptotermes secundus TaxID=105785 RepID=A0A2J7QVF8_9NEOP|nr:hypothetical protein B7P43_G00344 [Cryptotermes secundus]
MFALTVLFCCMLFGMLAVHYLPVYIIVAFVVGLFLFLFYKSYAKWVRVHERGRNGPTPFETILSSFRVWIGSSAISVMNTCEKLRSTSHRSRTNTAPPYAEGSHLTLMKTSQENHTSTYYSGLCGENLEYKPRNSFTDDLSTDSPHSSMRSHNRSQRPLHQALSGCSGDLSFSPKSSPWGNSVSPKLRSHGSGVKTIQTVGGPLLASTRFNFNKEARMFGDVCSPGFSSRVAHYASEDSKTLTHQKQYSGPGQFPLVRLDHAASRMPILSSRRSQTSVQSRVTVKVAPPMSSDTRFMRKSQIMSDASFDEQHSSKSFLDVLREMSRKRIHAQVNENEDDDIVKRQRKGEGQITLDNGSDVPQVQGDINAVGRRKREESPVQSEASCQPPQRQKRQTHNNEISCSLSSSRKLLKHMKKSTKRKSSTNDWSRSGTPVLGKPPKKSRESLGDATHILKTSETVATTSSSHTPVVSATTTTLSSHEAEDKSNDRSESVKPSEFLPKFAAVLDKRTGPVLNSVAALEAKRAHDRQTRLRSMLAVIAGEDDFLKEPSSDSETIASTAAVTTSLPSMLPPVAAAATGASEMTDNVETSVATSSQIQSLVTDTLTPASGARSPCLPYSVSLTVPNVSPAVPSTSAANVNFGLLGSVTSPPLISLLNKTAPSFTLAVSSPSSAPVSSEQKIQSSTLTSSSGTSLISGKSQSPSSSPCNGSIIPPPSKELTSHGSLSDSNSSGGFSYSSTSTVINVPKPVATEATKSLFSFGSTALTSSVNASANVTSNSVTGSVFEVKSSKVNAGLLCSPAVSAPSGISSPAAVSLFDSAKSNGGPSTSLSSGTLNFGIKPATSTNSPFQFSTATSSSTATSPGGFKFLSTNGMKENAAPTAGDLQPKINLTTSNTAPISTISAITPLSSTSSVTISAPASTSQSVLPFKFGTTPVYAFSNTSTANGPTQSSQGFPGGIFGKSQPETTNGVTQPSQQSPFTFGASSFSQNQSLTGTFTFGASSSPSSGVKTGNIAFGGSGGNVPIQTTQSNNGNLPEQASQPVFGSSENKTGAVFGTPKSTGGVFGSTHSSQPTGGLFGSSVAQSGGIFGSNGSSSGQVQSTGGIFGTGMNQSAQSLLPSSGVFGSTGSQITQPSSGLFGSSGNVSTPSTQSSSGTFGASGSVTTQATSGILGSLGNQSVPAPQPGTGLFGSVGSPSSQMSQPSGGIFGTQLQPNGGIFGSASSLSTQPAGSSTQNMFTFGSTTPITPAQQPATTTSTGTFGTTTPFQFGAPNNNTAVSASQPTGGFSFGSSGVNPSAPAINFTAGTSGNTPFQFGAGSTPVFGSQTTGQGMFSIGSGSTAPRARATRLRRQR